MDWIVVVRGLTAVLRLLMSTLWLLLKLSVKFGLISQFLYGGPEARLIVWLVAQFIARFVARFVAQFVAQLAAHAKQPP